MPEAHPWEFANILHPPGDLPQIEQGIAHHLDEAARLRDAGARLAVKQGWSEPDIAAWLIRHGATGEDARELAATVYATPKEGR